MRCSGLWPGLLAGGPSVINPKAYAVHITLFSSFALYPATFSLGAETFDSERDLDFTPLLALCRCYG